MNNTGETILDHTFWSILKVPFNKETKSNIVCSVVKHENIEYFAKYNRCINEVKIYQYLADLKGMNQYFLTPIIIKSYNIKISKNKYIMYHGMLFKRRCYRLRNDI